MADIDRPTQAIDLEHLEGETGRLVSHVELQPNNGHAGIRSVFRRGDVLFGRLRPYLKKYYCPERGGVCSTEIWVLRPTPDLVTPGFLYILIRSPRFLDAASRSSGTRMPRADWTVMSKLPVPVPPIPQQQRIVEIVTAWDEALDSLAKLQSGLVAQRRSIEARLLDHQERMEVP